ncbi:MAG: DUF3368 domain-containing protein [Verrucomicrobia bacterium]|nr:DUF3368 domain-containing protein [Verrucomicrobiota bacterium]
MIVVADTSVLINLCCIDRADLLPQLFREVSVPPAVATEFARLAARDPRFAGLALPAWIVVRTPRAELNQTPGDPALDAGEAAAIQLAVEIGADAILLDERHGYEAAMRRGLVVIGLLGVLLRAKRERRLPALGPELIRLQEQAGFWLSDPVRRRALELAGERP